MLHTNKKPPFLPAEKGRLPAAQLKLRMYVIEVGEVTGWRSVPGAQTMYNLEVTQDHTYTVGTGQWVVHNSKCVSPNGISYSLDDTAVHKNGLTIKQEMVQRGWDEKNIGETLDNPSGTVETYDNRRGPTRGNPATGFYHSDKNSHVVRNNITGEIIQISDRTDSGWLPFWNPEDVIWNN